MGLFLFCILWAVGVFCYFAPALVASQRQHPSKTPILVVNLFLGWLLIPWVICLAWALGNIERVPETDATCPYCHGDIMSTALRCRHCAGELTGTVSE